MRPFSFQAPSTRRADSCPYELEFSTSVRLLQQVVRRAASNLSAERRHRDPRRAPGVFPLRRSLRSFATISPRAPKKNLPVDVQRPQRLIDALRAWLPGPAILVRVLARDQWTVAAICNGL